MKFVYFLILLTAAVLLSACSTMDRTQMSSFRLSDSEDHVYIFETQTGISYPSDSEEAEKTRHSWIKEYMSLNELCPNTYKVISRNKLKFLNHPNGHKLSYKLKCPN